MIYVIDVIDILDVSIVLDVRIAYVIIKDLRCRPCHVIVINRVRT